MNVIRHDLHQEGSDIRVMFSDASEFGENRLASGRKNDTA